MKAILILAAIFLSSHAEASRGKHPYELPVSPYGCWRCLYTGISLRARLPRATLTPFSPPLVHQDFIWPPFPAKVFPYR